MARGAKDSGITKAMREKGFVLCTDVAEKLNVNKGTVYRWIRDGKVRTVNFSGVHYVEWSSVVSMLGQVGPILGIMEQP